MADVAILCSKCSGPYNGGLACPKCGGGFAKICGKCQFKNSLQKNFCDHCGGALTISPEQAAAQLDEPPKTEIRSIPKPAPAPGDAFHIPSAGRASQSFTPVPTPSPDPEKRPTTTSRRTTGRRSSMPGGASYLVKSAFSILFLVALGAAAWLIWLQQDLANRPEAQALRLTDEFLTMLSRNDYASAFYLVSEASKATCTLPEFRAQLDPRPWTFSDLKAYKAEPGLAGVAYTLNGEGRPPDSGALFFVVEGPKNEPRWVVAYTAHLTAKAEELLGGNNPDMALLSASSALRINPRDPAAQAVACRCQRARHAAEADRDCARALELSAAYPGSLSAARTAALNAAAAPRGGR